MQAALHLTAVHSPAGRDLLPQAYRGTVPALAILGAIIMSVAACGRSFRETPPAVASFHPVFRTPLTGQPACRPAVRIDLRDDTELVFGTAELYLTVQSSRFPAQTLVLLPVNRGDFEGCRSRFIQLPFEVERGDELVFNLLDCDDLTLEQEQTLLDACQLCGYCISVAGMIYCPDLGKILAPLSTSAAEVLGEAVLQEVQEHRFDNYGTAEYIVPVELPQHPYEANRLSLIGTGDYASADLRIYGPPQPLDTSDASDGTSAAVRPSI